jgi:hypothetical protein
MRLVRVRHKIRGKCTLHIQRIANYILTFVSCEVTSTQLVKTIFHNSKRLKMTLVKVAATSRTSAVAGAIAGVVREQRRAEVQAIGASAVNQAVKALPWQPGISGRMASR